MNVFRRPNTTRQGINWTHDQKAAVWMKGRPVPGRDPNLYRFDTCGQLMYWFDHGNRNSILGWEIDHIIPVARDGEDNLDNLQPLYWGHNVTKGDSLLWVCPN